MCFEIDRGAAALFRLFRWRNRLWIRFPLEEMKYLIFLFPCSGNRAKHVVEFRLTTGDAPRIQGEVEDGSGVS